MTWDFSTFTNLTQSTPKRRRYLFLLRYSTSSESTGSPGLFQTKFDRLQRKITKLFLGKLKATQNQTSWTNGSAYEITMSRVDKIGLDQFLARSSRIRTQITVKQSNHMNLQTTTTAQVSPQFLMSHWAEFGTSFFYTITDHLNKKIIFFFCTNWTTLV